MAVDRGDGDGIPQPQVVKLVDVRTHALVHLVHRQHNGLSRPEEHVGHLLVRGGDAGLNIGEKDDHVRVVYGNLRLLTHKGEDLAVRPGLDAAGVDEGELPPVPVALPIDAVPGDAGGVLHNGDALADEFIKEHGLAHIGPAHDSNHRF